ncbi:c-type cytochrome biogenesis protein CcmI [Pseudaestuariivita rosea]|uniref:c-type cytochrome biogenesis protein CcmI n=1 Tax=Pseudaestuariivita rosea TaxID=2763263 RepID=UPI001F024140|nr:c-type cytochrome biogenesis protein CcmI [Pseudaestuariivita rosea]
MFWILTILMTAAVALLLISALRRAGADAVPAAAFDMQVYREQLKEIDRDLARNVIDAEEAERLRIEVSRRILDADKKIQKETAQGHKGKRFDPVTAGVTVLIVFAITFATYAGSARILNWLGVSDARLITLKEQTDFSVSVFGRDYTLALIFDGVGAPGYGDLPHQARIQTAEMARDTRPSQAVAEQEFETRRTSAGRPPAVSRDQALLQQLRDILENRPDDLQGYVLLATTEARMQNFAAAHRAQARVIELLGDQVTAEDYADHAELMVLAAGGYVSPEAEAALDGALARDPNNGRARYYSGLMFSQIGRPDVAFRIWQQQLDEGPANAPWIAPIMRQIELVAMRAGAQFTLPDMLTGPTADDIAAAQDMDPEDRNAMIQGMVNGLADRLSTAGGPPEDWARLIQAYGVLGQTDRARAVWVDAQQAFQGLDDALEVIESAARRAGVAD